MKAETSRRLRRLVPWVVALGILAILFKTVSLAALRDVARQVNPAVWIPFVLVYVLAALGADSFAAWVIYRRSLPDVPLRLGETVRMRGATYLLAVVHYGAGQGGMAYFLKTRYGVPLARAAGAVILTMGTNAITIAACALLGIVLGGAPASPELRLVVLLIGAGVPVYLAVIAWRPGFLARVPLLAPLFDAGVRGHLVIGAARMPHFAVLLVGHFVAMRLFGIVVPPTQALALLPLVFIISVLPISPSGLGTAQATAVLLFAHFAPGADAAARQAAVLGYSLGLLFSGTLAQALVGVVFLRLQSQTDTIAVRDGRPDV
jgi:uncharacterized membrane protein YbhN (UPF0104 family)